jgi:hypothetical protein
MGPGVQVLDKAANGSPFSGGITPFKQDGNAPFSGGYPLLEFDEFCLKQDEFLFVFEVF